MNRRLAPFRRLLGRSHPAWHHPEYRLPIAGSSAALGQNPRRADDALTWAVDAGVIKLSDVRQPAELSFADAIRVHDAEWLSALDEPSTWSTLLGIDAAIVSPSSLTRMFRLACQGTLDAARHVVGRSQCRATNLLGGFHHAASSRGAGFCALNDVAIAIAVLRDEGFTGRIEVIDLDAHPPDGIVECLTHFEGVTVRSLGVRSSWSTPALSWVFDKRLEAGSGTAAYLAELHQLLRLPCRAELAFYLAGADPLDGDPMGGLAVSERGLAERDRTVFEWLGATPTVTLPAGGYTKASWRILATTMAASAGLPVDRPLLRRMVVPSPGYDPVLRRSRIVYHKLGRNELFGDMEPITEADVLGSLGVAREVRFLGIYTRHGIEAALTAYGLLPALRRMGFAECEIELHLDQKPDRITVSSPVRGAPEILIDLAMSVKRSPHPLLFIEWMELRDPRLSFTSEQAKLPGQRAPGLGLASEIVHMLCRAAERLQCDGLAFIPAHFHVAVMAKRRHTVLDPIVRGRFHALLTLLSKHSLSEVSAKLHEGGWPLTDGTTIRWEPSEMVIPLSEALSETLANGEDAAQAEEQRLLQILT